MVGSVNSDRQPEKKFIQHAIVVLDPIRARLCEQRDRLYSMVSGAVRDLQEADTHAGDFADAAQGEHAADVSAGVLDMSNVSLADTLSAIERIDNGTYGVCVRCNEQIVHTRLQALPTVQFCIECQRVQEEEVALRKWRNEHPDSASEG